MHRRLNICVCISVIIIILSYLCEVRKATGIIFIIFGIFYEIRPLAKLYSRLSLSRLRLSRITAYLEEKIWSLLLHRNLKSGYKILWKRGEIAPGEQFLPFSTIFSIYISN